MEWQVKLEVSILLLLGLAAASCSRQVLESEPTTTDLPVEATPDLTAQPGPSGSPSGTEITPSPANTLVAPEGQDSGSATSSPNADACSNAAEFVQDVTIPDGEVIAPGASFTKVWRLANSGTCTWDDSYALIFVDGDLDRAPKTFPLSQTVAPGESVDLSIPILAPLAPGDHHANWRLRDGRGNTFGVGLEGWPIWVRVTVQGDQDRTDGRATPVSDSPAAGVCGEADGELATMTLLPGIPDPRCLIVSANQRLHVVNRTEGTVQISLAGVTQTLESDGSFTFAATFGELLQPGVHNLAVDPCCGGEILLKE